MSRPLNVAVVGCGTISPMHLNALRENEITRIYAVCDTREERAQKAAEEYGCKAYTDFDELLLDENIDSVHICTPHYLHAPMAKKVLASGRHLLLEKPLATSMKDAKEVVKASENAKGLSGVCFQNRYNDTSVKLRELLSSGNFGGIKGAKASVTWHRDAPYYLESGWRGRWATEGGGVMINQAIHTLDLMLWLVGGEKSIAGSTATRLLKDAIEVEDFAEAVIRFEGDRNGLFYATTGYCDDAPIELEITCEQAVLKLCDGELTKHEKGGKTRVLAADQSSGDKAYWGQSHSRLIGDFYDCILTGRKFPIPPREAYRAIAAVLGLYEAAKTGGEVRLGEEI